MNCQIIEIESNFLKLEAVSCSINNSYRLCSIVEISKNNYLDVKKNKTNLIKSQSFGEIIELDSKTLKVKLLQPELFIIGKIIHLNLIENEKFFLPHILNNVITFGEKTKFDLEQTFEFIPTALVNEVVVKGQKIGYINSQSQAKLNFKYWILAQESGKICKIELGDFKIGEQVATTDKSNILLGDFKNESKSDNMLQKTVTQLKSINLDYSPKMQNKNELQIKIAQSNIIVDINKRFLNSVIISPEQVENYIVIFIVKDPNFKTNSQYKTITFFDKYNFGKAISSTINDLIIRICEIGYSIIIISQIQLDIKYTGQYKTINDEYVSVTYVVQDLFNIFDSNHFEHLLKID